MFNKEQKDLLAMTEEEVMMFYASVFLKQNDYGVKEFKNATVAFLEKRKLPLSTWRRELKLTNRPLKSKLENWSFDSSRIEQDFGQCLNRNVKYGNGGATTRILGYDPVAHRVLTESGSVYELVFETA